jgi:hypothetical protein
MSDPVVEALVAEYKQWLLGATKPKGPVLPKASFEPHPERSYSLKNNRNHHYLQHEEQTWGINLGWTDDGSNQTGDKVARWFFARKGTSETPISFGETIALGNGKQPSFVRYEKREWGINLGYSDTPFFEWKFLGGKSGAPVNTQEWIAIYNEKAKECLVYFDRTVGVGAFIGWPSSKGWDDQATGWLKDQITLENIGKATALLLAAL